MSAGTRSPTQLPDPVEQLTYGAESSSGGGVLKLTWENREYSVAFTVKK